MEATTTFHSQLRQPLAKVFLSFNLGKSVKMKIRILIPGFDEMGFHRTFV